MNQGPLEEMVECLLEAERERHIFISFALTNTLMKSN